MKQYERVNSPILISRVPVIIRLDGKAWHTFCNRFQKPFDDNLIKLFNQAAFKLCYEMQGAKIAYLQSDEISILLTDYDSLYQCPWFGYKGYKMVSISAAQLSVSFYRLFIKTLIQNVNTTAEVIDILSDSSNEVLFDSRVYNLPDSEVCNYFIWRQQDWCRNSIQMLARSLYSQSDLHQKKTNELHQMCFEKGHNWNSLPTHLRRGRCLVKYNKGWYLDNAIPMFTQNRQYIEQHLPTDEL